MSPPDARQDASLVGGSLDLMTPSGTARSRLQLVSLTPVYALLTLAVTLALLSG